MTTQHDVTDERHRGECSECALLWAELDAISAEAAQLPTLTPSRDLWSGIEARITADVRPVNARPTWYRRQGVRLALAASLLVAVSSAVTWRIASSPRADESTEMGAASGGATGTPAQLASFDETVSDMDREISALERIVAERRATLDPATLEILETNLKVIDDAIAESRRALEADPASGFLATQYTRAYTSKLTLLRDAATLPTGI